MSSYARQYKGDVLYRAVIQRVNNEGEVVATWYRGPYDTSGKAQARLTGDLRRAGLHRSDLVGHVEGTRPVWTPLAEMDDLVSIPRAELQRLTEADELLDDLHANGVDNWEGYDDAARGKDVDE